MALKFIVVFLITSTLMEKTNSVNPLINIDAEDEVNLCSKNTQIFWKFAWKYFENRHAITIFASKNASVDFISQILNCGMMDMKLSLQYNATEWYTTVYPRRSVNKTEVFHHHEVNGLIFILESVEKIGTIFPTIDPQTRTIIMLMNSTAEDVNEVLTSAWSQNHILNLVVFNNMEIINETLREILQLSVSTYSPFVIINNSRGHIYTFEMNDGVYPSELLDILKTRLMDVHGYPLRTCSSNDPESTFSKNKSLETVLVKTLIETINFDVTNSSASAVCDWQNFRVMDEGNIDLMTFTRSMKHNRLEFAEFLSPIDRMVFGFVKAKTQLGIVMSFVKIFTPRVFILLASAYVTMVIIWKWFQKLHHTFRKSRSRELDFMEISSIIFGNFLLISQPESKRRYERCLFIGWIFFSMVICYSYQAMMVKYLVLSNQYKYIKTVDELIDSGSKILFPEEFLVDALEAHINKDTPDSFRLALNPISFQKSVNSTFTTLIEDPSSAMMFYFPSYYLFTFKYQTDQEIYILEERLGDNYNSFVVPIDSPYRERFDQVLMFFLESGLIPKWLQEDESNYKSLHPRKTNNEPAASDDVYKMKDLSFVFWSWLGSCSFCSLVFLMELLWSKVFKKKQKKLR